MSQIFTLTQTSSEADIDEAVSAAIQAVTYGGLAVIPTDTSYAVIADAFNPDAMRQLRDAKGQSPEVSVPIGAGNLATIEGVATLTTLARDLVNAFWPGALTVLTKAQPSVLLQVGSSDSSLATRIPNNEVARAVLGGIGPTAMTGAQKAGEQSVTKIRQAQEALGDAVTVYIDSGELSGNESTVVDATSEYLRLIRPGVLGLEQLRAVVPMIIDSSTTGNL